MEWNRLKPKSVCRRTLTRAHIEAEQKERVLAGREPATVEQIVNDFVCNHQLRHVRRAMDLMR